MTTSQQTSPRLALHPSQDSLRSPTWNGEQVSPVKRVVVKGCATKFLLMSVSMRGVSLTQGLDAAIAGISASGSAFSSTFVRGDERSESLEILRLFQKTL